ncbi:SRPBCC family protein [Actinophytocola oryzae]|uniref:Uncharacterized protein YndB with AHSA1/START domain n=1 Tax=Actinophytocola oryzae TaxID=502181 RepID=A0A4V6Q6S1_9PSEU|nr:SRPBCC family protein [Actinophytocola oryzae]TDV48941.1 uncharacterized protein YndB with AHSA1/START domain [Actinophytocola oryzae]
MIDVVQQVNAVSREVGTRVFGPGEARVVKVTQTYAADPEDVWDACTSPERLARWFLPVTGELRLGGRYQLEGNAGGTVERCDAPKSFFVTWEMGDQASWLEVRVVPEAQSRTRLELEHIAHVSDDLWDQFGPGAVGLGWDLTMRSLATHLAPDEPDLIPAEAAAWPLSPEGVEFVSGCAEAWYRADVASGHEESKARAAADQAKAFYTTAPEPPSDATDTTEPKAE